jgi:hypothetical protein
MPVLAMVMGRLASSWRVRLRAALPTVGNTPGHSIFHVPQNILKNVIRLSNIIDIYSEATYNLIFYEIRLSNKIITYFGITF